MVVNCLPAKRKMAEAPNSTAFNLLKAPPDEVTLVSSLRTVKNQIIGNHHKKIEYRETGLIPVIIGLAEKHSAHAVLLQVSAILYSMAAGGGTEAAIAIEAADGPQLLCRLLDMKDADQVVLGATRALKHLYDHPVVSAAPLDQQATHVALVRLAAHPDPVLARYAIQILSVITRARVAGASTANGTVLAQDAHTDFMSALLQQLPRCLYANPVHSGTSKMGAAPDAAMDAAGPASEPVSARKSENKSAYVPPKAAPQSFAPLRTTVLTAIDTLLRQHPPSFTPTVCTHLPDIAAAIRYPDADTRMSACALVATLLQPDRRIALQHAVEWPEAREHLFDMFVRGSSIEHGAEAAQPNARDAMVVSTIELAALTALIKLQALPAMRRQVPLRLLELVGESDRLQRAVADSNALEHLTAFILAVTDNAPWRRRSSTGATASASNAPTASGVLTGASAASPLSQKVPSGALSEDAETLVTPSEEDTMQLHSALLCVKLLCSCGASSTLGGAGSEQHRKAATPAQCVRNCCAIATPAHLRALACCLRHPSAAVRTSAAQVFQVMGRSTRATTKECFGDSALATTLVDTLSDVSASVQEAICFAICNLCATSSCPARRRLLEKGVIGKLAEITMSCEQHPEVRLPEASLRALANAINNTTLEQRENLMATWPWASVHPLLTQNTTAVCLHTWELLQNLSNSSDEHPVQQAVLKWAQGGLLPLAHTILADNRGTAAEALSAPAGQALVAQERSSSPAPMDAVDTVRPDVHDLGQTLDAQPVPPPPPPVPMPMSHQDGSLPSTLLDPPTQPPSNARTGSGTLNIRLQRSPEGGAMVVGRGPQNWLHGAADDTDTGPSQFPNEREAGSDTTTVEDENQRMRSKVVEHALFVLSNLATGDEGVISAVMDSGVPALLPSYLNYSSGDPHSYGAVRVAACWLVTNLTHVNLRASDIVEARQQAQQRARTLDNTGVLAALQNLLDAGEDIGEVLHRARNALKNFASCRALQQAHDISLDVDEYHREPSWAQ